MTLIFGSIFFGCTLVGFLLGRMSMSPKTWQRMLALALTLVTVYVYCEAIMWAKDYLQP